VVVETAGLRRKWSHQVTMKDLKEKTIRGGLARMCAQGANLLLRVMSLIVLARILEPTDFGLIGMVTAFTGILGLFRDFGLSSAAIQQQTVTDEQVSTLFWINVVVGILLGCLTLGMAPVVAAFYREPRLLRITAVLAIGFFFNAAGVQHGALLQRQMRFTALAVINTVALVVGTAIAIGGAKAGWGYWSLVAMTITVPLIITVGSWCATTWVPGVPHRQSGIRSMMHFGGLVTLNSLVVYVASNCEKVLLGRFWGVDALGLYGRAYQLINIPTENLNSSVGEVAFSALSRVQNEPARLRSYFLKGYSLLLAMTLPLTLVCAIFADDVILVALGPKWKAAADIFRLLAPTILVFAIVNPLAWLLSSLGLSGRLLKMGLVVTPFMITAYIIGLPHGPQGVALAYSAIMLLWIIPAIAWAVHGTVFSIRDILGTASRPLAASMVAAGLAVGVRIAYAKFLTPIPRLALESSVLIVTFVGLIVFATGQKAFYVNFGRELLGALSGRTNRSASPEQACPSASATLP
jgi:O-antigen/teichoic acid export membrane protein